MTIFCKPHTGDPSALLTRFFSSDKVLVDRFHLRAGDPLAACVADTAEVLVKNGVEVYTLHPMLCGEPIGYLGIEHYEAKCVTLLTGFFLYPEFRSPEIKQQMMRLAFEVAKTDTLHACVYCKNTPANKFLAKHGELIWTDNEALNPYNIYKLCRSED